MRTLIFSYFAVEKQENLLVTTHPIHIVGIGAGMLTTSVQLQYQYARFLSEVMICHFMCPCHLCSLNPEVCKLGSFTNHHVYFLGLGVHVSSIRLWLTIASLLNK